MYASQHPEEGKTMRAFHRWLTAASMITISWAPQAHATQTISSFANAAGTICVRIVDRHGNATNGPLWTVTIGGAVRQLGNIAPASAMMTGSL
jgi:hypothetical protein